MTPVAAVALPSVVLFREYHVYDGTDTLIVPEPEIETGQGRGRMPPEGWVFYKTYRIQLVLGGPARFLFRGELVEVGKGTYRVRHEPGCLLHYGMASYVGHTQIDMLHSNGVAFHVVRRWNGPATGYVDDMEPMGFGFRGGE